MKQGTDQYLLDARLVRESFGRAAPSYEKAAVLQREVGNRLFERLEIVSGSPRCVLDAGCGTGFFTAQLLEHFPGAEIIALDIAPPMLEAARKKNEMSDMFSGVCANIDTLPLERDSVDTVYCNLVIQWCNDLDRVFSEFARVLKPSGWLIFSSFGPDTLHELRAAWQEVDDYNHVNRFIDMHDLGDALVRAGFREPVMDAEIITLTYASVVDLMHDLKAIGAHNLTAGRPRGLMGKKHFAEMQQEYEAFRTDTRIPATYETIYGSAWIPDISDAAMAADGEISLAEMQRLLRERAAK